MLRKHTKSSLTSLKKMAPTTKHIFTMWEGECVLGGNIVLWKVVQKSKGFPERRGGGGRFGVVGEGELGGEKRSKQVNEGVSLWG